MGGAADVHHRKRFGVRPGAGAVHESGQIPAQRLYPGAVLPGCGVNLKLYCWGELQVYKDTIETIWISYDSSLNSGVSSEQVKIEYHTKYRKSKYPIYQLKFVMIQFRIVRE